MEIHFMRIDNATALKALLILMIAMILASPLPAGQSEQIREIRIQIMDSKTLRPLKSHKVQITFSGTDGQWYHNAPRMIGRTGSDGVVVFEVKLPITPMMDVVDWWAYPCSNPEVYSTQTVFQDGVVAHWRSTGIGKADRWCTADSQAPLPQKQPGKVIFFVHPLNRYAWYDLWK
jgi:hypothetical protein